MPYTPTEWKAGDVVTAEKLNKLEYGVTNNEGLTINVISDSSMGMHLDKTYGEIKQAMIDNKPILCIYQSNLSNSAEYCRSIIIRELIQASDGSENYYVYVPAYSTSIPFEAYEDDMQPYIEF